MGYFVLLTPNGPDPCRLRPGEFLNDNLIDFTMKTLTFELPEELRVRLRQRAPAAASHTSWQGRFFSSFFRKKVLGDGFEDELPPGTTAEARAKAAHQRVARWTRGLDVFTKDYLFVPNCGDLHWTLAIIVNSGVAAAAVGTSMELDAVAGTTACCSPGPSCSTWTASVATTKTCSLCCAAGWRTSGLNDVDAASPSRSADSAQRRCPTCARSCCILPGGQLRRLHRRVQVRWAALSGAHPG